MTSAARNATLLRALIDATGLSRRKAFVAIREGRVSVDGAITIDPSAPYSGGEMRLDDRLLSPAHRDKVYLLMNKPAGVITATSDPHGRATVLDLVPVEMRLPGLHPVGRLDQDTTGLLLLTNDGDLTFRLTHPSHEVEKEYWFSSRPPLTEHALERLRHGVELDGKLHRVDDAWRLEPGHGFESAAIISEGRKRQVKRMVETVGAKVLKLARVREGGLRLIGLPEGEVRPLRPEELTRLLGTASGQPARPGVAPPRASSKPGGRRSPSRRR